MLDLVIAKRLIPLLLLFAFLLTIILKDSQFFILLMYATGLLSYIFFVSGQFRSLVSVFLLYWLFRGIFQNEVNQIFDPVLVSSSALVLMGLNNFNRRVFNSLSPHRRMVVYLLLFNCLMSLLYYAKFIIFPEFTATLQTLGKDLLFNLAFVSIIIKMESEKFSEFIDYMVLLVTVSLSFQAIFADQLNQAGFMTFVENARSSGVIEIDQNEFSRILAVCSSYLLMKMFSVKNFLNRYSVAAFVGFLGILVTGSRAGFVVFVIVASLIIVSKWNFDVKKTVALGFVAVLGLYFFMEFGSVVSDRLQRTNLEAESRPKYLAVYLEEILQNPEILIAGASKKIVFNNVYDQSVHNAFIQIIYDLGLIVLFLLMSFFIKLFYLSGKKKFSFNYRYPILIYLLISLTLSQYSLAYLPIIIALSRSRQNAGVQS